ncbi:hypothetical protein RVIR1_04910 [Candidatus Rickettsiella viridis]|uniref:Uncharacterized protein n=1 Tax=Candidatus Rickettsiella viridis TaxID=676208 RepID=A0A2Z5V706_9COXI|nr:hypothetical protein [Candidatus Rickettsiella viridis]BBB14997.1 hypothetical protein RVIR1_04910 [Candidatus Rickettsiella viridis]
MKVIILSNEDVKLQREKLEELIKVVGFKGPIKNFKYSDYFVEELEENDTLFVICPKGPNVDIPFLDNTIISKYKKIIPVCYDDSKKENMPTCLHVKKGLYINGNPFLLNLINSLSYSLDIPNLCTDYFSQIKNIHSLQQSSENLLQIKNSLLELEKVQKPYYCAETLDHAIILDKIKTLHDVTSKTAENLHAILTSLSASQQNKIYAALKNTLLGECLEKIDLEKSQEAAPAKKSYFRL